MHYISSRGLSFRATRHAVLAWGIAVVGRHRFAKRPISHRDSGRFTPRNGPFCTSKWAVSQNHTFRVSADISPRHIPTKYNILSINVLHTKYIKQFISSPSAIHTDAHAHMHDMAQQCHTAIFSTTCWRMSIICCTFADDKLWFGNKGKHRCARTCSTIAPCR